MADEVRHLRSVEPLPPPAEGFDIEAMLARGRSAHYWGQYYQAGLLLTEAMEAVGDTPDVIAQHRKMLQDAGAKSKASLQELNNHYQGLFGQRVEILPHTEIVAEEINDLERQFLERRFHEAKGAFMGFDVKTTDGLCLVLDKVGDSHYFPLYDIEYVEPRGF